MVETKTNGEQGPKREIRLREDLEKPHMESEQQIRVWVWERWVRPPIKEARELLIPKIAYFRSKQDAHEKSEEIKASMGACTVTLQKMSSGLKSAAASIRGNEVRLPLMAKFAMAHNVEIAAVATDKFLILFGKISERMPKATDTAQYAASDAIIAALDAAAKGYGYFNRAYGDRGFINAGSSALDFAVMAMQEAFDIISASANG